MNDDKELEEFRKIEQKLSNKDWLINHPKIKDSEKIYRFEDLRIELNSILDDYREKYFNFMSSTHWYWKSDLFNYFRFCIKAKSQDPEYKIYWSGWISKVIVNWLIFDEVIEDRKFFKPRFNN